MLPSFLIFSVFRVKGSRELVASGTLRVELDRSRTLLYVRELCQAHTRSYMGPSDVFLFPCAVDGATFFSPLSFEDEPEFPISEYLEQLPVSIRQLFCPSYATH